MNTVLNLSATERECLRRLAQAGSRLTISSDIEHALLHLESLGLVERVPQLWLPLEMIRMSYRLTPKGRSLVLNPE